MVSLWHNSYHSKIPKVVIKQNGKRLLVVQSQFLSEIFGDKFKEIKYSKMAGSATKERNWLDILNSSS